MTFSRINSSSATKTRNRVQDVCPISGICSVCLDGCAGNCEIWKSSLRGREVIYPQPFGKVTAGADKDYPIDYSHLNIQGTCVGARGITADSDKAIFPHVQTETEFGAKNKIKMKVPVFTGALGSTDIARVNWEHMAVGAAISGICIVIGENVCGMDPDAVIKNGKIVRSPELERRVKLFQKWHDGEYGEVIVQTNVEDSRLGVLEYVIRELGVRAVELKWGQGAKDIGGEVKLPTLERAKQLKSRGYVVIPDPSKKVTKQTYKDGGLKEFERHSRLGMVKEEQFYKDVERLRKVGAKYITLKTGAYRGADLARALKYASNAKLDLVTIDGAGGGTGMSPWRMMNEWGIPTIYLQSLAYQIAKKLEAKGKFVPDLAMAGGFSLEDHIFKVLALGAPYFKAVCMGRAFMIPAMVGKHIQFWLKEDKLPNTVKEYGGSMEEIFIKADEVKSIYADKFKEMPLGAIGMYTFCDRIMAGLQQFMAGARKFKLHLISRDDLISLTKDCAEVTGIPFVMDGDAEEIGEILDS